MTTNTIDDVRLLRPRETAELLAVSRRQLDRLVEAGVVKPVRLVPNGNRRFRLSDLAELAPRPAGWQSRAYESGASVRRMALGA